MSAEPSDDYPEWLGDVPPFRWVPWIVLVGLLIVLVVNGHV